MANVVNSILGVSTLTNVVFVVLFVLFFLKSQAQAQEAATQATQDAFKKVCLGKTHQTVVTQEEQQQLEGIGWPLTGLSSVTCKKICEGLDDCTAWWSYDNENQDCYLVSNTSPTLTDSTESTISAGVCTSDQ